MAGKKVKKMFGGGLNNLAGAIQKQPFAGQMRQAVGMDDRPAGAMPQRPMPSQSNFGGRLRGLDRAAMMSGRNFRGAPPAQTLGNRNLPTASPSPSPSAPAPSTQLNALQGALAGSPTQAPVMATPPTGYSPDMAKTGSFGAVPAGITPMTSPAPMKKGGSVKAKYSIDGIAQRGKTRAKLKGK